LRDLTASRLKHVEGNVRTRFDSPKGRNIRTWFFTMGSEAEEMAGNEILPKLFSSLSKTITLVNNFLANPLQAMARVAAGPRLHVRPVSRGV
jgi:hypothetical protein